MKRSIDRSIANLFGTYRLEAAFGTPLKSEIGSHRWLATPHPVCRQRQRDKERGTDR